MTATPTSKDDRDPILRVVTSMGYTIDETAVPEFDGEPCDETALFVKGFMPQHYIQVGVDDESVVIKLLKKRVPPNPKKGDIRILRVILMRSMRSTKKRDLEELSDYVRHALQQLEDNVSSLAEKHERLVGLRREVRKIEQEITDFQYELADEDE